MVTHDGATHRHLPTGLRVEYEESPENVDPTETPRFAWRGGTDRRGGKQRAYRVVVGRDRSAVEAGRGGTWDSGRVDDGRATNVAYDGPQLDSDATYHWSVKLWTDAGETGWADPARFSTALEPEDWRGEWISHQPEGGDSNGWRSQWRDERWDGEEWVQVDLGERRSIDTVGLHPAEPVDIMRTPDDTVVTMSWRENPLAGFGFPDGYRIEVSDSPDFENATVVSDPSDSKSVVTQGEGRNAGNETVSSATHDHLDVDGRYVRVTATDLFEISPLVESPFREDDSAERTVQSENAWRCFALAGLTVRDLNGNELARDGAVEASSTVESGTWGRGHLVNGHTRSTVGSTSPLLRTELTLDKPVRSARIHVAAVGYGELYVNGEKVGDGVLDPAWTDYERRVLYSSHDVTDRLTEGENALGLWLGRGWFSKTHAYWVNDGSPRGRATLSVEFEDGTERRLATDGSWRAAASPIRENDIYNGERYDARREFDGWASPAFDDDSWDGAAVVDAPGGTLRPERIQSMGVVDAFEVQEVHDHPNGPILDFGQNLTGWLELTVRDPDAGDEVTLRHAEALTEDGDLSTTDLRTADATDTYLARGDATETYEPRFTYHGFRYAQVSGYPGDLDSSDVTAKAVHTAMDRRGEFACSNDDLNQLQHNSVWGLRSNTHSIPEDCPQRDERFGWTGDAHISTRSLLFNFDAVRFDEKWARDHDDAASPMGYVPDVIPNKNQEDPADPTWSITRVMIPWYLYLHDGNERLLREQYEGMRDYLDYWYDVSEDGIVTDEYGKFGDWLTFENADGRRGLPHDLYNTAFCYQVTDTFAKIADVVGSEADAENYRERAEHIKTRFNDRFFDAEENVYGPGTQSSYAVPLFLGMVPESAVDAVASNLAEKVRSDGRKLKTGFLGTRPLIHTLANHGYDELAYDVVSQPEQPGWVYMARNGATTMWERWNSDESVGSGMNSLNHSPYTHVSEFFYEVLAGIKLGDEPVTDHVTVEPSLVDDLEWVSASVDTSAGELAVEWEREEESYELDVTVPWNGSATVRLPDAAGASVTESGDDVTEGAPDGVSAVERDGDDVVLDVGAGSYSFSVAE
ncbi:family 78 glycoside hydrolase catalytic domain [Halogeometricum sp. S1BR25-6]|uniref:alpha-L-rhamnosidase n=1 Tax=Halogeometricum salsisoli TaxID=2950536 RepID=A0ABU2GIH5_9EURY|nr:family 78 glycoside hydrolase catalytic domain [Halogeometricum sp. S1BR25-6]MDS0300626.1 family 78 glycoside hydrolase catalytic domain [Halogeometricum sp. S1BR25-6]